MMVGMNSKTRKFFLAAATFSAISALAVPASAGVIASSVLEILNFQIRDAATDTQLTLNGPGSAGVINIIGGNNTADVSSTLNGVDSTVASPGVGVTTPPFGAIDLGQQCVGTGCAPFGENTYGAAGQTTPPGSTYALSDMQLLGSALDASGLGGPSGGANARTRADVSIAGGTNDGSSTSNTGADVAVALSVTSDVTVEFSFDFLLNMLAFVDTSDPDTSGNAQTGVSWSMSIFELADPTNELRFAPFDLNRTLNLSVDADVPLSDSGSFVTGPFLLEVGKTYQFGVSHSTRADAAFRVPEASAVAILGLGLLGLGLMRRKTAA